MNIEYNKKKQEMRDDPLIDMLADAKEFTQKHTTALMAVAAALVFVFGVYVVYNMIRQGSLDRAQEAFGKAMVVYTGPDQNAAIPQLSSVSDNHRNTPYAVYSAYLLGGIYLSNEKYDEAIQWFTAALSRNKENGFVGAEAAEALAAAYEGKGDLQSALKYLDQAAADSRLEYRHPALLWKIALLTRDLKQVDRAQKCLQEILSDTTAVDFKQKAENLLVEIKTQGKS